MRKLILLSFFVTMLSCQNKELKILSGNNTCGCTREVAESFFKGCCRDLFLDCSEVDRDTEVMGYLQKTIPIYLENSSRTIVYKVLVQKDVDGKVSYQSYTIEPTESRYIGCNRDFSVEHYPFQVDREQSQTPCEDGIKITNMAEVEVNYKIHNVEKIKKY